MKKLGIKVITMLLSLVLITLCFSGCIDFSEFTPPPEGPSKHPDDPAVAVDSEGNVHIVWENGTGSKEWPAHLSYMKLDDTGNKVTDVKILSGYEPKLAIDGENNIHVIDGKIHYTKLNSNGEVLINRTELSLNDLDIIAEEKVIFASTNNLTEIIFRTYGGGIWYSRVDDGNVESFFNITPTTPTTVSVFYQIHATIDIFNNLHIAAKHIQDNGTEIAYIKLNETGGVISQQSVTSVVDESIMLRNSVVVVDREGNAYVFWERYNSGSSIYWDYPLNTYYKKFCSNGTIQKVEIINQKVSDVCIDSENILHVFGVSSSGNGTYIKLTSNGSLIKSQELDITSWKSFDADIDSEGNCHIVWQSVVGEVWQSGRHYEEYYFYTIYYSKLDSNGTALIDKMVIDSDGEPSWENTPSPTSALLCGWVVCLIAIATIVVAFLFLRRKHAKHP